MKSKLAFFYIVFSFIVINSFSQNEANIWYFGDNAGVDFASGSPVTLTNGALATREGCATISDDNGDILFYSEGTTIMHAGRAIDYLEIPSCESIAHCYTCAKSDDQRRDF